jgi:cysteine-rich repeat protein
MEGEAGDSPIGGASAGAGGGSTVDAPTCGDAVLTGTEAVSGGCDDGNTEAGDGCSDQCAVETGWDCDASEPTQCSAICGDGLVVGPEAMAGGCDDGQPATGDGCNDECQVEVGFVCQGEPSECAQTCGNAKIDPGETCEDGNQAAKDGCFSCTTENGYSCDNATLPSKCLDIDECKAGGGNDCSAKATCTNTVGSFTCKCIKGYTGDGKTCANVNECELETDNCHANAACTDTGGSFTCKCKAGYTGNGLSCERTSCVGLANGCGQFGANDCCAAPTVTGGVDSFGVNVATFALDKYEVTVGRFKNFINAYGGPPANGAGANPSMSDSGWQSPAWNSSIAANKAGLTSAVQCSSTYQTYTSTAVNDFLPMNCVSWYEALAFCAWDGGFLPSNHQWLYAARGGEVGWTYPWGFTPVPTDKLDSTADYANYGCMGDGSAPNTCAFGDILRVGQKPAGTGKYGQLDLAGSMFEWTMDPCVGECEGPDAPYRPVLGGSFAAAASTLSLSPDGVFVTGASTHGSGAGFRCARAP